MDNKRRTKKNHGVEICLLQTGSLVMPSTIILRSQGERTWPGCKVCQIQTTMHGPTIITTQRSSFSQYPLPSGASEKTYGQLDS